MQKVISPNTKIDKLSNAVFLAGPCPREDYEDDWRNEAIKLFEEFGFDGDIISPTNPEYDGNLKRQTSWEHKMLCLSSAILFWIPRSEKHPAFTTNIEFGEWFQKENVFVGFPDDSIKNEYIDIRLEEAGLPRYKTLKETVKAVVNKLSRKKKIFFTSDTHFTAQRTLELSYRPFRDVQDMDENLISNWNKRVTKNDIIIHLGDFGNPNVFKYLNCFQMYFLPGNYERKIENFSAKEFFKDDRVVQIEEKMIKVNGTTYYICHEPLNNKFNPDNKFYLYGHIHRLQMVKRNGINVGCDANRFTPMSVKELEFLKGGVEKHFDENVFTDKCK